MLEFPEWPHIQCSSSRGLIHCHGKTNLRHERNYRNSSFLLWTAVAGLVYDPFNIRSLWNSKVVIYWLSGYLEGFLLFFNVTWLINSYQGSNHCAVPEARYYNTSAIEISPALNFDRILVSQGCASKKSREDLSHYDSMMTHWVVMRRWILTSSRMSDNANLPDTTKSCVNLSRNSSVHLQPTLIQLPTKTDSPRDRHRAFICALSLQIAAAINKAKGKSESLFKCS